MEFLKKLKRTGALCLVCAVLFLFTGTAYLQGAEEKFVNIVENIEISEDAAEVQSEQSKSKETQEEQPGAHESGDGQVEQPETHESKEVQVEQPERSESEMVQKDHPQSSENEIATEVQPGPSESETVNGSQTVNSESETPQDTEPDNPENKADNKAANETGLENLQTETVTETGNSQMNSSVDDETDSEEIVETEMDTELTLADVMEAAKEQDIDLFGLAPGESITFTVPFADENGIMLMAAAIEVKVTRVAGEYLYADYGYGTYQTHKYQVSFNGKTATAYCVNPSLDAPGIGNTYMMSKMKGAKILAKVCYYGTLGIGSEGFFEERHPDFNEGQRFIITHLAASYANGSSDAFSGANSTARGLAMELYNYCVAQPDIPEVDMEFSDGNVSAYIDGTRQRTKEITFDADSMQSITLPLPDGVKLHNVTTGETSKAGASVEIHGGTVFYLSAPLTQAEDVGPSWAVTMKGSITKDYSAYIITTGATTQNLALVFGEGVDDEKYIEFAVKWVQKAKIEVLKVDDRTNKGLSGAVFGVYRDEACTQLLAKMPKTDSNGKSSVEIELLQETVYLQEITAPDNYIRSDQVYTVKLKEGKKTSVTVPNTEQLGSLSIYKEGAVLTGASVTESGTAFHYEVRRLPGAAYNVYAAENITSTSGDIIYKTGDMIAENLTTAANGSVTLDKLHFGKYTVREMKAPANYYNGQADQTITVSASGANVEVLFTNEPQKADVTVLKVDKENKNPLSGAVFGLYADTEIQDVDGTVIVNRDTLIGKVSTGADGIAKFTEDLPIGFKYYIKELQAPDKYLRNTEEIFRFSLDSASDKETHIKVSHTFENVRVNAKIRFTKKDAETGTAQGDATLEHAVYGLYARENISHPDGKTGVVYRAGEQVMTFTTDANGQVIAENLYLGKYYVKELSPSNGYTLDTREYDLTCDYAGDLSATIEKDCNVGEIVIKQPFQIIKIAGNGKTDADTLAGAGFSAYLESSLKKDASGAYDFAAASPVVIGENDATEIFTDATGYAVSIPLPFGTYIVRETTVPSGYTPVKDFVVRITENKPTEPQAWRVLVDEEFEAKLKIIKSDDETQKVVLVANTEFKVYDIDAGGYVEQVTTYPTTVTHTSYFTDECGYLILPQSLPMGHYRIEEVSAPDGYTVGENHIEIDVDSNAAYKMDSVSGDAVIEVAVTNHPVKGELRIVKKGEMLNGYKKDFIYEPQVLEGAVFEVYAAEDICTADFQTDSEGDRILEYPKDSLVAELITDESGEAVLQDLPLGSYRVVEKTAPDGFIVGEAEQNVQFIYVDQDTPVIIERSEVNNERPRVEISVIKKDAGNEEPLAGAEFGLYVKTDILSGEKVIAEADALLATAVTDESGKAIFEQDIPFGEYYIRELKAPEGYVLSEEIADIIVSYEGQETRLIQREAVFMNNPTTVEFTKSDITTGEELDGAVLSVLDKKKNVIDSWTSVRGKPHMIKRLHIGETYILREEFAPYGYLQAEEVEFTVSDTAEIQKVEMRDAVPVGRIIINKKGEFAGSISWNDMVAGTVEAVFGYVLRSMEKVTFEVYALEDIKAADGVSQDYYKKDDLVATITTDTLGYARTDDLPLGKYYVVEKETAEGFVLDNEARKIDLSYRDQETPVVTYDQEWQNLRQKARVTVLKKEKGTQRVLPGAVFALCAKEDIIGVDGNVIIKADTVIEQKATGQDGTLVFTADLPIGATYYVKEVKAPAGFVSTEEIQEFTFTYAGWSEAELTFDCTFENRATKIKIKKTDIVTSKEIPGAKLQLTDSEGNLVDEWISGEKPHYIEELPIGRYTLREETAPKGYLLSEEVPFEVKDTGEIQTVEMFDDHAMGKVVLTKKDKDTEKPMEGVEFSLCNEEGKVLEVLVTDSQGYAESEIYPIAEFENGKYSKELVYTLKETKTLDGYKLDETEHDIRFVYEDDTTPVIECKMNLTNERIAEPVVVPQTGDETPLLMLEFVMAASACSAVLLAAMKKYFHKG